MQELWCTAERKHYKDDKFFAKRSLRPSEYIKGLNGLVTPRFVKERLQNEADCLQFIRSRTNIPVPNVEYACEVDDVYYLIISYEEGETLDELDEEEKAPYLRELEVHLNELHHLRSQTLGGPGGLIVPPLRVLEGTKLGQWQLSRPITTQSEPEEYMFCHNDLAEHNVIVDTAKARIKAIIDWEFAGFWPAFFEAKTYTRKGPRAQFTNDTPANLERMEDFLRLHKILGPTGAVKSSS